MKNENEKQTKKIHTCNNKKKTGVVTTAENIFYAARYMKDNKPASRVEIIVISCPQQDCQTHFNDGSKVKVVAHAETDEEGHAEVNGKICSAFGCDTLIVVPGESGPRLMRMHSSPIQPFVSFNPSPAVEHITALTTDRLSYKPGDVILVTGVLRQVVGGIKTSPPAVRKGFLEVSWNEGGDQNIAANGRGGGAMLVKMAKPVLTTGPGSEPPRPSEHVRIPVEISKLGTFLAQVQIPLVLNRFGARQLRFGVENQSSEFEAYASFFVEVLLSCSYQLLFINNLNLWGKKHAPTVQEPRPPAASLKISSEKIFVVPDSSWLVDFTTTTASGTPVREALVKFKVQSVCPNSEATQLNFHPVGVTGGDGKGRLRIDLSKISNPPPGIGY